MIKRGIFLIIIVLIFSFSANAEIFLGVCDGYVFNMSGGIVSNASVTVNVNGCSGGGCTGSTISQPNGYYIIANLNFPTSGSLNANAVKTISTPGGDFTGTGNTTTSASDTTPSHANITLCFAPSSPSLILVSDSHNNSVDFDWSSGTDPLNYSTHDEFWLDSGAWQTKTSGFSMNVNYTTHTWRVRTCNSACCSAYAQDSFNIYNNAPTVPALIHQNNTHLNYFTFYWTNSSDSEGDEIYYQFQFDSEAVQNNSISPVSKTINISSFGAFTWRVRACDFLTCSAWGEDTFTRTNGVPSAPVLIIQPNTTNKTIILNWSSGIDTDLDPTHDEFQFSIYYDFSTNIISSTNTTHPLTIANLSNFERYYWRIRTCDLSACSLWSSSSFVKYVCNATASCNCSSGCGGGGNGGGGGGSSGGSIPIQTVIKTILPESSEPIEVKADKKPSEETAEEGSKPKTESAAPLISLMSPIKRIVSYPPFWIGIMAVFIITIALGLTENYRIKKRKKIDEIISKLKDEISKP